MLEGEVVTPRAYRPSTAFDFEDTVAAWSALAIAGTLIAIAGLLVVAGMGEAATLLGVGLFFGTAVVAGADRIEVATALGVGGVICMAAGVSAVLGSDPSRLGPFVGLAAAGALATGFGGVGALRAHRRSISTD